MVLFFTLHKFLKIKIKKPKNLKKGSLCLLERNMDKIQNLESFP